MKKIVQITILSICLLIVTGCNEEIVENDYRYTLHYYYLDVCNLCNEFSEEGIPLIEDELGDIVEIVYHDLDDVSIKEEYDEMLSRIDVDSIGIEYYGIGPTLILEDYFIKVGIYPGDYELFVQDIKNAINGEPLSDDLSFGRALFIDSQVVE